MSLTQRIKEKAISLGFDLVGIAPADRAPHAEAYHRWLANGYAAQMSWLARDPERRVTPRLVLSGAQSAVVVGLSYFTHNPPAELWNDPSRGRIARYAWGLDYHEIMLPRLRELGEFINTETRFWQKSEALNWRAYVDTGPILERDLAAQAGLGFIGKNCLLINPRIGAYLFLGEILLDFELEYDEPIHCSCGNCSRCLTICPTQALPTAYLLDSNCCISYLTIEHKESIPLPLRPLMGNWIFGCDACQEICPWVRRYSQVGRQPFLHYDPEWVAPNLLELMALDETAFRSRFKGTPILRSKRRGLLRNVAIALGNWGNPIALPILQQATQDPEPLIREHAQWAIERIKSLKV